MNKRSVDLGLFTVTIALLVIGIFMVFDASYARAGQMKLTGNDSLYFMKRQALFAIVGLGMMFLGMRVPYQKLRKVSLGVLVVSIIGLALVFVPGLGVTVNGATRWIKCPGFQFQPSELAKLGLVLYMASYLTVKGREIRDLRRGFVPALIPLIPIGALVMLEPDMGTTIVLMLTALAMIGVAGAHKRHVIAILLLGLVVGSALILTSNYRKERVMSFRDPFADYYGSGYQVSQSLIALGSGGPLGVGLCESREKLFYLPAEHTDFIFAVLGEEAGLKGTLLVTGLFLLFGARGFKIAGQTKDSFGRLVAAGISVMISGQALLNMCVVTSSVPATGVPLPFISYGGSSLALNLLCAGILLGISKYGSTSVMVEEKSTRAARTKSRKSRSASHGSRVGARPDQITRHL